MLIMCKHNSIRLLSMSSSSAMMTIPGNIGRAHILAHSCQGIAHTHIEDAQHGSVLVVMDGIGDPPKVAATAGCLLYAIYS